MSSLLANLSQVISRAVGWGHERVALPDLEALARTGVRVEIKIALDNPSMAVASTNGQESPSGPIRTRTVFQYEPSHLQSLLQKCVGSGKFDSHLLDDKPLVESVGKQSDGFLNAAVILFRLRSQIGDEAFEQMRNNLGTGASVSHAFMLCEDNIGELARRFANTKFDPQDYSLTSSRYLMGLKS